MEKLAKILQEETKKKKEMKRLEAFKKNFIGIGQEGTKTYIKEMKEVKENLEEKMEKLSFISDIYGKIIDVEEIEELRKITLNQNGIAVKPKNDSRPKRLKTVISDSKTNVRNVIPVISNNKIHENAVFKMYLTTSSNDNRNETIDKVKRQDLSIKQATEIPVWTNKRPLENTATIYALLVVFDVRNSPHNIQVPLNMLDASDVFMEEFRGANMSFQLLMRKDSISCYEEAAMQNLRSAIKNVSQRLNENEPRNRVHFKLCPEIFEEACREAGIKVTPDRKCDDLLTYVLHFPSNCRMVLAIPMNNPEAMGKK